MGSELPISQSEEGNPPVTRLTKSMRLEQSQKQLFLTLRSERDPCEISEGDRGGVQSVSSKQSHNR